MVLKCIKYLIVEPFKRKGVPKNNIQGLLVSSSQKYMQIVTGYDNSYMLFSSTGMYKEYITSVQTIYINIAFYMHLLSIVYGMTFSPKPVVLVVILIQT